MNNVQRGQAEIYVVLDHAQIGVRIREFFALDIDRQPMYMESFGLLDVLVSVPPSYHLVPPPCSLHSQNAQEDVYNQARPHVEGLLLPSETVVVNPDFSQPLTWARVNDDGTRSLLNRCQYFFFLPRSRRQSEVGAGVFVPVVVLGLGGGGSLHGDVFRGGALRGLPRPLPQGSRLQDNSQIS